MSSQGLPQASPDALWHRPVLQGERCEKVEFESKQMKLQCEQRKNWCLMGQLETFNATKCKVSGVLLRPEFAQWELPVGDTLCFP